MEIRKKRKRRGTNKEGFFENIRNSCFKASLPKYQPSEEILNAQSYINFKFTYINWWFK